MLTAPVAITDGFVPLDLGRGGGAATRIPSEAMTENRAPAEETVEERTARFEREALPSSTSSIPPPCA